jgi:hypothetical protein
MVVRLLLGLVYVLPATARSVDGAGLPDVPLFVQPASWSFEKSSVVLSGRLIELTRPAES